MSLIAYYQFAATTLQGISNPGPHRTSFESYIIFSWTCCCKNFFEALVAGCPSARWSMGLQIAVVAGFDDEVEYDDDCDLYGHHGIDGCVYGVRVLSDV